MKRNRYARFTPQHRTRRSYAVLALGAAVAVLATGCGSSASSSSGGSTGSSTQTLTIGSVQTMSGPDAQFGQSVTEGAQQAISEINASGGVKVGNTTYKLALSTADDTATPARGVAQFKKLVAQGDQLVIGPGFSAVSTAIVAEVDSSGALDTITGGPLSEKTLGQYTNAFQTQLSPTTEAVATAWFLADQEHAKRIGIISDSTSTFDSSDYPAALKDAAQLFGLTIVKQVFTQGPSETDYSSPLLALENAHLDAVVSAQTSAPNALIVKQARQAGYTWPIIATAGAAPLEVGIAGSALNGTFDIDAMGLPEMVADNVAAAITLNNECKAKNCGIATTDPGGTYTNGYAAIYAYAAAIKAAGTVTDIDKVRAALASVKLSSLPAVVQAKYIDQAGGTFYNSDHAAEPKIIVVRWENGVAKPFATYEGQK
jgi:branched-chain amino acid transport system substrate-binding protein